MSIVTKGGDGGTTALLGGKRVQKDDIRVECYGTIDELSAFLGFALSLSKNAEFAQELEAVQHDLHLVSSIIALQCDAPDEIKSRVPSFDEARLKRIEDIIAKTEAGLPPLAHFILYGGTEFASALHLLRAVSRRAERRLVGLDRIEKVPPVVLAYMNRLSDLFFVLARAVNSSSGVREKAWRKEL